MFWRVPRSKLLSRASSHRSFEPCNPGIIFSGWHSDGNDISSVIVRDKAEIGGEFTVLKGGQHGISVDDGYACYEAKDEQGYHEEDD